MRRKEPDDCWPKSEKDLFQALRMVVVKDSRRIVVVKDSRWKVVEFYDLWKDIFLWSAPVAFRRVALETSEATRVGMALVLPALTDCRWWFESLLVHSTVISRDQHINSGLLFLTDVVKKGKCAVRAKVIFKYGKYGFVVTLIWPYFLPSSLLRPLNLQTAMCMV